MSTNIGNKARAFVVGVALYMGCGNEPDNITYVINTDKDKEYVCQEVVQHVDDCDGFSLADNPAALKQKAMDGCLEYGHLYPPEFWECIFQQCGPKMIGACDEYINGIGK